MNAAKKVSVVIPCYNAGATIEEAVRSVFDQSYPNLEIIIVDDGSTDQHTLDLLSNADWGRTKIIWKHNSGPASARNRAITESTGDYILPLDADDRIDPTYIEKAVKILDERPDVGIVYCKAMRFGDEEGPWGLPPFTVQELTIDNVIFVTSLFRREDWEAVGGFSESLKNGVEDYDFWLKIVGKRHREVVQIDEPLFFYRIQEVSRTTKFTDQRQNVIDTYSEIFRNNTEFFSKNAHYLFEHRFGLYDELMPYRERYARLDGFLRRHPRLERFFFGAVGCAFKIMDSEAISRLRRSL